MYPPPNSTYPANEKSNKMGNEGIQQVNLLPPMPGNAAGKSNGVISWSMVVGMMVVEPDSAFAAGAVTTAMGEESV